MYILYITLNVALCKCFKHSFLSVCLYNNHTIKSDICKLIYFQTLIIRKLDVMFYENLLQINLKSNSCVNS